MRRHALAICSLSIVLAAGCAAPVTPNVAQRSSAQRPSGTSGYTETLLHRFESSPDAASPEAGVIFDSAGNLYGTTIEGGANQDCPGGYDSGCGAVYEIDAAGKYHVTYSFAGMPDASEPFASLLLVHGTLYGTTAVGGNVYSCFVYAGDGCGTIFKVDPNGKEHLLYQFRGNFGSRRPDGQDPQAPLVVDSSGNLYGTTAYGGADEYGTIFKVSKTGKEKVLYSFTDGADGGRPYKGVVRDASGNLYGAAYAGGNSGCVGGCGTIFELSASGTLSTLYTFKGASDGGNPYGGLMLDPSGNLYGTAQNYGNTSCNKKGGNPGCGTVFRLNRKHKFKVLHVFAGSPDGAVPNETLIIDKHGNLYGTTSFGGDDTCNGGYACGVVFEIDAHGKESLLHTFTGGKKDGEVPYGGVTRDASGDLYGTTVSGGIGPCSQGCGIVFKLTASRTSSLASP
ncbi:MAG TPA: choice-of-anchor tandem repeat GloVer-containing protein [Candidatus Cybelea sp.]